MSKTLTLNNTENKNRIALTDIKVSWGQSYDYRLPCHLPNMAPPQNPRVPNNIVPNCCSYDLWRPFKI